MAYGRVKVPASAVPVTLSSIGGDPERSRTIKQAGEVTAKDRDELQALLTLEGSTLLTEPQAPDGPATTPAT